jgi:hypothetical protein
MYTVWDLDSANLEPKAVSSYRIFISYQTVVIIEKILTRISQIYTKKTWREESLQRLHVNINVLNIYA